MQRWAAFGLAANLGGRTKTEAATAKGRRRAREGLAALFATSFLFCVHYVRVIWRLKLKMKRSWPLFEDLLHGDEMMID
jgi:hypothetical protein